MNNPKVVYEDNNLAVLDKPTNLVVHKVNNHDKQLTLVDFIIKKWPKTKKYNWQDSNRTAIVHRLDKNTSGIIIIAKNPKTQTFLQSQFKKRLIKKEYTLLCLGKTKDREEINTKTTRDAKKFNLQKTILMSFSWQKGKSRTAVTKYETQKYYQFDNQILSLVKARIITGRTHQIRNHFKFIGHPIIGDQIYATKESKIISDKLDLHRQFLHSSTIAFRLASGTIKKVESKLPIDLTKIIRSKLKVK